jgi:hypothetical protein
MTGGQYLGVRHRRLVAGFLGRVNAGDALGETAIAASGGK